MGTSTPTSSEPLSLHPQLGEGGFSYVYAVHAASTSTPLALKRVLAGDADRCALARREAALCARLASAARRGALPLLATGETQLKHSVIAVCMLTPLAGGGSLAVPCSGVPLPPAAALAALADVAAALATLHEALGMAHFDVKPHNILLVEDGDGGGCARGVLTDLGSARAIPVPLPSRREAAEFVEWAAAHCTAAYRAPELFEPPVGVAGGGAADADAAAGAAPVGAPADIWALGCTIYAALTASHNGGELISPFEREGAAGSMHLAVAAGRVVWPVGAATPRARALVASCLQPDPRRRPSAAAVTQELDALAAEICGQV